MFLLCLLPTVPRKATIFRPAPDPCSQCSVMTTRQSLQAFAGEASSQEPALLRGAVTQPGPTLLRSSQGQQPSLPAAGPRATSWASSSPAHQDGPLQLGAANSALRVFSKKQTPWERGGTGQKGRPAGPGSGGQAGPFHGAPTMRPPRG